MKGLVSATSGLAQPCPMAAEQGCERKLQGLVKPRLTAAQCHCCHFLWTKVSHGMSQTQKRKEQPPRFDRRCCKDGGRATPTVASGLELRARRGVVWSQGLESLCDPKCKEKLLSGKDLILGWTTVDNSLCRNSCCSAPG